MRRLASFLLLTCFLALGTGTLEYWHDLDHARQDALEDAQAVTGALPVEHHHHDENNCAIHAQLHMPALHAAWVPILICLGLWIAFLTLLSAPLIPRMVPVRIDCRGPPAFWL